VDKFDVMDVNLKQREEIEFLKSRLQELEAMNKVNRIEVIDQTGRAYTHYLRETESVRYSLQDDNRTLKIFIDMNGSVARDDQ
jgi:hypothetical protein